MAFLAIEIPKLLAAKLSKIDLPGKKERQDTLHITLFYFSDNYPLNDLVKALKTTLKITSETEAFAALIEKVSHFPSDEEIPIIVPVQSNELHYFREGLAMAFDKANVPYSKKFKDYNPHITLSYAEKVIDDFGIEKEEFQIDKITLFGGDNYDDKISIDFALKKETTNEESKIPLELLHKLPPKTLLHLIQQIKDAIRQDETLQSLFEEYDISPTELDLIPMQFADIDTSAKTDHGIIYFNYKLLCDGDLSKVFSYAIHETTHFLQQTALDKATKGAEDGDYLHNPFEQEGFINQIEYIANNDGKEEAKEYVADLLDHHDKDGKEKKKLEKILLKKVIE